MGSVCERVSVRDWKCVERERNCILFHFIVYSGSLCKNCISFRCICISSSSSSRPRVNFINALMCSFYRCRSQKRKKRQSSLAAFCTFGICTHKSCTETRWWNWPQKDKMNAKWNNFSPSYYFYFDCSFFALVFSQGFRLSYNRVFVHNTNDVSQIVLPAKQISWI